jgi:hypothetical protein
MFAYLLHDLSQKLFGTVHTGWDTPLHISHKASLHLLSTNLYVKLGTVWPDLPAASLNLTSTVVAFVQPAQTLQTQHFVFTFYTRFAQQPMVISLGICNRI